MTQVYNQMVVGFVASDSRIVLYVKQEEGTQNFALKILQMNNNKETIATGTLSHVLRQLAENVAQYSNGFTSWKQL